MNERLSSWILFFIYPFFGMLLSFKMYTSPYAKNIFWAFCIFFGLTFAIGEESSNSDVNRYVAELQYLHNDYSMSVGEAMTYFKSLGEIDIVSVSISYILSRFTDSQAMLTMVYAIIFGFFFSRNIWSVFDRLEGKLSLISKVLLIGLILVIPIWFINGFRMWTAFHIFMYGLLPYIFQGKKDKIIFLFLSFLVHFSFLIPISIFLVYWVIGNRVNLFFILFSISSFISEINITFINDSFDRFIPEILVERTSGYRNEEKIAKIKELREASTGGVWYVRWKGKLLRWSFYVLLFYLFFFANPLVKILPYWKRLFSINLLFFAAANILANLPSGGRYMNFSLFLTFIMAILYLDQFKKDNNFKILAQFLSPAFVLFIVVSIRIGLYSTSLSTVMGNPIIAFFSAGETVSVNDFIK